MVDRHNSSLSRQRFACDRAPTPVAVISQRSEACSLRPSVRMRLAPPSGLAGILFFCDPWVLLAALLLDFVLADPWGWPHPVRVMGSVIDWGKDWILAHTQIGWPQRLGGGVLTGVLIGGSYGVSLLLIQISQALDPRLGWGMQVILLASCLGARSLRGAAREVLHPLKNGDLITCRRLLSRYVGRDTETLSIPEICRALVETVAENTPDGATAPLFYGVLGGAPLAMAYKAVSTLDSMVGYRRAPYTYLGTIPARLEDLLTWIPCRLTVLSIALAHHHPWWFWQRCQQDALADPSPNSGWSEAAFAWSLGLQLGGVNVYQGIPVTKPYLGSPLRPLDPQAVEDSLQLLRQVMGRWLGAIALLYGGMYLIYINPFNN